jgi:hypothetical protein
MLTPAASLIYTPGYCSNVYNRERDMSRPIHGLAYTTRWSELPVSYAK